MLRPEYALSNEEPFTFSAERQHPESQPVQLAVRYSVISNHRGTSGEGRARHVDTVLLVDDGKVIKRQISTGSHYRGSTFGKGFRKKGRLPVHAVELREVNSVKHEERSSLLCNSCLGLQRMGIVDRITPIHVVVNCRVGGA